MSGSGTLLKANAGVLTLTGNSSCTGATTVNGGGLVVNGSLASTVTVNGGGTLGGAGTIAGLMVAGGTVAPGNSIGTLNVTGNFAQNGGTYQVEVNPAGQSDRINVGGAATINGGTVQVLAQPGTYGGTTRYTILNATGGVTGSYAGVASNFAFLTPTLSYTANTVLLDLVQGSFAAGAQTPNQAAVGAVLDAAAPTATGDFATVINAIAVLNTQQGPAALTAISGQNYSGMSSAFVQSGLLFMSNFVNQAGGASRVSSSSRSGGNGGRVALAEACDVACDTATSGQWGVWGGPIGGLGTLGGNGNTNTLTYNVGGFATGLDRQVTPELLLGVTLGFTTGTQYTSGFVGRSTTNTFQGGLYGSFMQGPFYLDGLAGYAYGDNQMQRMIAIPGLQPRTANGRTGANQLFGQIETGYRLDVGGAAEAYVTPFVRLQGVTTTQNAFSETGANSLNLNVAAQTTNSLRTVLGAQIGGTMNMGWREKLAAQFKLGWSHEFANTDRPVTASFAGAPALAFTTFGAAPQRDGIVIGLNATTGVAEATSIYFRYEGELQGVDNAHALSAGVRFTW